jgi:hypothetical protein
MLLVQIAHQLSLNFGGFLTPSGYELLDERQTINCDKVSELLRVLEHPELPLHNNPVIKLHKIFHLLI